MPAQYPERFVRYFARLLVRANKIVVLFHMKCKFLTNGLKISEGIIIFVLKMPAFGRLGLYKPRKQAARDQSALCSRSVIFSSWAWMKWELMNCIMYTLVSL